MTYSVKEIYYTLQGEGAQTGRPAVFLRFAGCNLWSGREEHRKEAVCRFCDTEFVGTDGPGGGKFESAAELAVAVRETWPTGAEGASPYVVCTGGEPLLQLDGELIAALHTAGFEIGVESNGTLAAPAGIDWLCISPKGAAPVVQRSGDELKLVFPQQEAEAQPHNFVDLQFKHFFLQPLDDPDREKHTSEAVEYCLAHPQWMLSVQTHKVLGIA
ncbi:MAG: 7-carboxy-7-deazaguanine synthase [Gammaproteobacteria bacterium]|nr:7-carboxy-7-deazaguanine synthase [Gammaproteobacteria bacterium]